MQSLLDDIEIPIGIISPLEANQFLIKTAEILTEKQRIIAPNFKGIFDEGEILEETRDGKPVIVKYFQSRTTGLRFTQTSGMDLTTESS